MARPNIDAREESNKKFNDAAEEVRNELSEELGREATYEDFIKEMIRLGGKEKIKDNLESIKRAFEANGHKTSDVSHLFDESKNYDIKKYMNIITHNPYRVGGINIFLF